MKTYEIDKNNSAVRDVVNLSWLNNPTIFGDQIFEINFNGQLSYRLIDHYVKGLSLRFEMAEGVYGNQIVCSGNRIMVHDKYYKLRIF